MVHWQWSCVMFKKILVFLGGIKIEEIYVEF